MSRERYQDALWYNKPVRILIFGAGGIGSWSSFFLTRAGFDVRIFDFDRVEEHNLGGQMFLHQDIGKLKIDAVNNVARLFNNDDYVFRGMNFTVGHNFSFNDRGGFYEYNPRIDCFLLCELFVIFTVVVISKTPHAFVKNGGIL
jgi:tRNA A37 threonylcarbamoyladenosine dehydratase